MNPYILCLLSVLALPLLLGFVVTARVLYKALTEAKAGLRPAVRGPTGPIVPLLDEPFPCPTCARQDTVSVGRGNFKEMPYVEHFVCRGCGTEFLGPNQEAMVAKRIEARRKFTDAMLGRTAAKLKAVPSAEDQ